MMISNNHYDWLYENWSKFLTNLGVDSSNYDGLIVAHGDKCWQYKQKWENAGIQFEHGVCIYLLTYVNPWSQESRETNLGWVDPSQWVINNFKKFSKFIPTE